MSNISIRSLRRAAGLSGVLALTASGIASAAPAAAQLAQFPDASSISSGRGYVAILVNSDQAGGGDGTLYVGHPGSIAPAKGVGTLPGWAKPHIGIDAAQRTVVLYPRCTTDALTSCDLYSYALLTGQETALPKVNTTGGELEAAFDHGALAFARFNPKQPKSATGQRSLYVIPRGAKAPRLLAATGGRDLAIQGGRVAQVRDTQPGYGNCGYLRLEIYAIATGKRSEADHSGCGLDGQQITSPTLIGDSIVWVFRSTPKHEVLQRNLRTGALQKADLAQRPLAYSAANLTSGYLLEDNEYVEETNPPATISKVTGLTWTAAKGH